MDALKNYIQVKSRGADMDRPCFTWMDFFMFPYWKEKTKNLTHICSDSSSPVETSQILPGSQKQEECCQMKMSARSCLLISVAGLEETAPLETPIAWHMILYF